jgi:hypothetical protein
MELSVSMEVVRERREELSLYSPSWIDRLTRWVEDLPGRAWCYYLALVVLLVGVQLAIAWWEGSYRHARIGFTIIFTGSSVYYLTMIHYLDEVAAHAITKFRPSMCASEQQVADLSYGLTHLPARIVRLLTLIGIGCALLMIAGVEQGAIHADQSFFGTSMVAHLYWRAALIADQIMFWNLIYHTVHQLRIVNLIYTKHAKIDLFNLSPLYAFSRLTACTAASTILIAYLWLATYPWLSNDFVVIGSWLIGILAAMAGFILPLLGIHRRLVEEKQRWKVEAGQWLKVSIINFHHAIAERKLEEIDPLLKIMEGVNREQAILEQIPTWPWQPGTVRGLTTTILVPVFLWLIVRVLEHLVIF